MSIKQYLVSYALAVSLSLTSMSAFADDHPYTEGSVVNVTSIRAEDGKFDDYMMWLDTTWKAYQEASKKMGDVLSYQVIMVEPRSENDPNLYLVVVYKNWAAFDGAIAKNDALAKAVEGSVSTANQTQADRGKIRRVLGSWTGQYLNLK